VLQQLLEQRTQQLQQRMQVVSLAVVLQQDSDTEPGCVALHTYSISNNLLKLHCTHLHLASSPSHLMRHAVDQVRHAKSRQLPLRAGRRSS